MPTIGSWRALPYPHLDGSDPANIPADIEALAAALAKVAIIDQGLASARPAAGRSGFIYYETDTGLYKLDIGTAFVTINPAFAGDGDPAVPMLRSLGTGPDQAAAGNDTRLSNQRTPLDASVTGAKLADTLVPSRGAGAGVEAVRALGTGGANAAAGNDARFPSAAEKAALAGTNGTPGAGNKFVTDQDLRLGFVGEMRESAGPGDPNANWMLCDGRALSRTTYAALFAFIGTAHGAGDGSTTFNIPDVRGRTTLGPDNMGTARGAAGRLTTSPKALGLGGGEEFHTLTVSEMPAHNHVITISAAGAHNHGGATGNTSIAHAHSSSDGHPFLTDRAAGGGVYDLVSGSQMGNGGGGLTAAADFVHGHSISTDGNHTHTGTAANTGGGAAHNNLPPYTVINKVIRVL